MNVILAKYQTWLAVSIVAFFATIFFFISTFSAQAASLYLSPSNGTYKVGQTFTVGVYVTSTDMAVNAYSGSLFFPQNIVDVTGISKSGITSLWVSEPTYSNAEGYISFEGIVLNPGFTGSGGSIISVTFKTKASGTAPIKFTSSSVLANDGLGTNILSGVGNASFTVGTTGETPSPTPTPTPTPTPAPAPTGVPGAPVISSSSHPSSSAWYASKDINFSWPLASSVTGVNILANHDAGTDPGTTSDGVFSTYSYKSVDDGVWYMHVKFQNEKGWGPTSHFKFQVDSVAPEMFTVKSLDGKDVTVAEPKISFFSKDTLSGIREYVVKVNDVEVGRVSGADQTAISAFTLPAQTSGEKTITVEARDMAGNTTTAKTAITITLPLTAPAPVISPVLTEVPFERFPSLTFITVLAVLLLLLALLFAGVVLWRSSSSWRLPIMGYRRRTLLNRLISLRTYVARHFTEIERDILMASFTTIEKKTAKRVATNLHELQDSLTEEIDFLSD